MTSPLIVYVTKSIRPSTSPMAFLSVNAATAALGLSRRMIAHYRTGFPPVPRVVALACEGLSARWKKRVA